MSPTNIPGYPYPVELHEHLDALISAILRMQELAIHPDGNGAGAVILFLDEEGIVHFFTGSSERNRKKSIRICAEQNAFNKLVAATTKGLRGKILAIGVAAAVNRRKDLLSWLLNARPPCDSCRDMLSDSEHVDDGTPIVMVNKNRTMIIHPFGHVRQIYDMFPG